MKQILRELVKGKKVAILGFGREGKSTLRFLMNMGADKYSCLSILDKNDIVDETFGVETIVGADYQFNLNDYDVVIKSPGIVLEEDISSYKCNITSQTEIFFEAYRDRIIGITGTKGKSTTTTLVHHILKCAGHDCILAGNIGIPAFDIVGDIHDKSIIVFEMSSHMLEYMKVSPHIGVLMNIYEEHLDHYGTMEKYVAAKENIYANQTEQDICFTNSLLAESAKRASSKLFTVSNEDDTADIFISHTHVINNINNTEFYIPEYEINLIGEHNYFDIAIAYGITEYIGIDKNDFMEGLKSYVPLPHRLEYIGTVDGVRYYDDSISTICDTTIQALKSVPDVETIIIGGMDRGIDYTDLIEFLSTDRVSNIILMYDTGLRIYNEIKILLDENKFINFQRVHIVEDLEQAVKMAKTLTKVGKSCVMSPGAASYGIFKNFEDRGNVYRELVKCNKK